MPGKADWVTDWLAWVCVRVVNDSGTSDSDSNSDSTRADSDSDSDSRVSQNP